MTTFAVLALSLAGVGIYGVVHYAVAERTREIGVRVAFGASPADVMRLMVAQGMRTPCLGIALGLGAALGVTRLMSHLLFGVGAADPATFALVALVLAGVAMLACYVPARRAKRRRSYDGAEARVTMSLIRHVAGGLRALLFKSEVDREIDDEVRQYLEAADGGTQARRDVARTSRTRGPSGVRRSRKRKRGRALRRMGGAVSSRGLEIFNMPPGVCARAPGLAIAAIAILGTGIALTTSMITVASTVLRQQWPVTDPSRVFTLLGAQGGPGFSPAEAKYFGEHAKTVSGVVVVRCISRAE